MSDPMTLPVPVPTPDAVSGPTDGTLSSSNSNSNSDNSNSSSNSSMSEHHPDPTVDSIELTAGEIAFEANYLKMRQEQDAIYDSYGCRMPESLDEIIEREREEERWQAEQQRKKSQLFGRCSGARGCCSIQIVLTTVWLLFALVDSFGVNVIVVTAASIEKLREGKPQGVLQPSTAAAVINMGSARDEIALIQSGPFLPNSIWPDGIVPFAWDTTYTRSCLNERRFSGAKKAFKQAMSDWSAKSCVVFKDVTDTPQASQAVQIGFTDIGTPLPGPIMCGVQGCNGHTAGKSSCTDWIH